MLVDLPTSAPRQLQRWMWQCPRLHRSLLTVAQSLYNVATLTSLHSQSCLNVPTAGPSCVQCPHSPCALQVVRTLAEEMAGAGLGRGLATPLLVINFCLYLIAACLAGWALNRNFDAGVGRGAGGVGNNVTQNFFLPITLIACMVGLASCLAGAHHMRLFRSDSLAAAAATSLIAWLLVLLAMGLACKQIHTGGNRPRRLKIVEAFMIILALFELLYLLSLHLGFGRAGHNHGTTGAGQGIGMGGHNHNHHTDYGHHTDMKIPVGHVPNPAHPGY